MPINCQPAVVLQDDVKERLNLDKPWRNTSAVGRNTIYGEEPLSAPI